MTWLRLDSGRCEPAANMALDEALLQQVARLGRPVVRFYGWTEPAATFGYFQKYGEIARATHLRPLIRRPTGGGLVPHDADWTYSVAFPPDHAWHALRAEESYRRIHDWLRRAFAAVKVATELAPAARRALPGQCFSGHEKHDLLWQGRKIAGAAQRRNRLGLLIQGSIQPPPLLGLERHLFEEAFRAASGEPDAAGWTRFEPDAVLASAAERLAAEKFSQDSYNHHR